MLKLLFAHDGEDHSEEVAETTESFVSSEFVIVPLYLAAVVAIFFVLIKLLKLKITQALLIIMGLNLLVGLFTYNLSPAISVVAITLGITLALVFTVTALMGGE